MVSNIVGGYLVEKGLITAEQLSDLIAEQQKVRVKLGLIAVAEGLMTQEQAEKVNTLQAVMDKRFGDIAVEKGFLTEGQVDALLKKQGNAYLAFAQALENQQLMTVEQLEQYLIDFRHENQLTVSDIEDLKSDDVDRILPLYMPVGCEKYAGAAGTALRTMMRCIDSNIYPGKAVLTNSLETDNCAVQYVEGNPELTCAMAGKGDALLPVASVFGKEEFEKVDADALDAVGELLNCINGLYASAQSKEGISMELCPPEYYPQASAVNAEQMLVLPVYVKGKQIDLIIAVDNKIEVKQEA